VENLLSKFRALEILRTISARAFALNSIRTYVPLAFVPLYGIHLSS